jgi:DNA repair exonuclease SbcCD ATPase subunit
MFRYKIEIIIEHYILIMVKIIHISDIHIKNRIRHDEYIKVFNNLYESVKNIEGNKIIAIIGDIMDHHGTASSEATDLMFYFITKLSELCDVIIISGNHDIKLGNNENSKSIIDATIPYLNNSNIHCLNKNNRIKKLFDINFILTDLNEQVYKIKKNKDEINIGLYHGTLNKSITDMNYKFENEKNIKASDFKNYDYVLLGDIHKMQYLNKNKTIAYSGSLIQQNYGESIDNHGYILWDLINKTSSFVEIHNDHCYAKTTIVDNELILHEEDKINKLNKTILDIEIYYNKNELNIVDDKIKELKKKYTILSNKKTCVDLKQTLSLSGCLKNSSIVDIYKNLVKKNNDVLNEDIINEFLNVEKIISSQSNKMMKLKYIKFKNILSYKGTYEINFEKMTGLTTITGSNGIGKSSIIDIILYLLYDKPTRGSSRKLMNVENYDDMGGEICLNLNGVNYIIERTTKESSASLKCFKLDDDNEKKELVLGETKTISENEIKKMFGNNEMLSLLSLYLQEGDTTLSMSDTNKYTTFLNLLNVNKYYEIRASHATKFNSSLKNITSTKKIIEELKLKIEEGKYYKNDLLILKEQQKILLDEYEKVKIKNIELTQQISNIDYDKLKNNLMQLKNITNEKMNYENKLIIEQTKYNNLKENYTNEYNNYKNEDIKVLLEEKNEYKKSLKNNEKELNEINNHKQNDDIQVLIDEKNNYENSNITIKQECENKKKLLVSMNDKLLSMKNVNIENIQKIQELFTFNVKCKSCESNNKIFIDNQKKDELLELKNNIKIVKNEISTLEKENEKMDVKIIMLENTIKLKNMHNNQIKELLEKNNKIKLLENINLINNLINATEKKINGYNNFIKNDKILMDLKKCELTIQTLNDKIESIEKNKYDVSNIENSLKLYDDIKTSIDNNNNVITVILSTLELYNNSISKLLELNGGISVHTENLNIQKELLQLYIKENEISKNIIKIFDEYDIINELTEHAITELETSMNDMIMTVMNYKIKIELKDKELIIYKIENGTKINSTTLSGSQKFIIGLALKCSLNKIGLAFKTNFQIIDEHFNCIDEEKILKLDDLLSLINKEFEMVLIITHNDEIVNKIHKNLNLKYNSDMTKIEMITNF